MRLMLLDSACLPTARGKSLAILERSCISLVQFFLSISSVYFKYESVSRMENSVRLTFWLLDEHLNASPHHFLNIK